jgi:hypothetical protein
MKGLQRKTFNINIVTLRSRLEVPTFGCVSAVNYNFLQGKTTFNNAKLTLLHTKNAPRMGSASLNPVYNMILQLLGVDMFFAYRLSAK